MQNCLSDCDMGSHTGTSVVIFQCAVEYPATNVSGFIQLTCNKNGTILAL